MSIHATELATIFVSERGRLKRLIGRIIGDRTAAEDLVQEAFLRVSRASLGTMIGDRRGYLVRAATNLALDYRRRLRAAPFSERTDVDLWTVADPAPSPETTISDRQALAAAIAALQRLPITTRRAFEMHRLEARTMADIAAELHISTSLVFRHIREAYTAVRDELRQQGLLSSPDRGKNPPA